MSLSLVPGKMLLMAASVAVTTVSASLADSIGQNAPESPASYVLVTTRVAVATNAAQVRGKPLKPLQASVRLFGYKSYRLLLQQEQRVPWKRMAEFQLPGGRRLLVRPSELKDGRVLLNVMLIEGRRQLVNTVLKVKNRGRFMVGGPRHEEGVLILSIGASAQTR